MITPTQYATQINHGYATGPRTPQRKAASSRNAVKHGLTGTTFVLLPGEDRAAFEALSREYKHEWEPSTAHETFLVNQMVQARWKLDRIARMEAEWYNDILNVPNAEGRSDEQALVYMAPVRGHEIDKLHRYARETERAYFRAVRELRAYRAQSREEAKNARIAAQKAEKRNEPISLAATASAPPEFGTIDPSMPRPRPEIPWAESVQQPSARQ
jgi:hypothetical protein